MTGRLNLFQKHMGIQLSRMHWKRIASSSDGGYGLRLQWGQLWLVCHWWKRHCPTQYSETCSAPLRKHTYLYQYLYPLQRSWWGILDSPCSSVCPSVLPSAVGVRMITRIIFIGVQFCSYMCHLGEDLGWDWIWAPYLINMRIMTGNVT